MTFSQSFIDEYNQEEWLMAGQIIRMINSIIDQRSKGNETIAATTRTKFILKGINPAKYDAGSPDDGVVIEKLKALAQELNVKI